MALVHFGTYAYTSAACIETLRIEPELKTALREIGAEGCDRGYDEAAAGRGKAPGPV